MYDYMGRRVRKDVFIYDNGWPEENDPDERWHFVYDGWNVVMMLDGLNSNAITRKYTWGLDLSQSIHGAGGIGGLLSAVETQGTEQTTDDQRYWSFYDANGNVTQVLDATNTGNITLAAHYEYDPYGNLIASSGTYAAANPFRFSTKWLDDETGQYYYGRRYYDPRTGRWTSKDPSAERGGLNLYTAMANSPVYWFDPDGAQATTQPTSKPSTQPPAPRVPIPDYGDIKKQDGDAWYAEWREQFGSEWHRLAAGELESCPPKLELPPPLESSLREALRRTLAGKEVIKGQPNVRYEHAGALVYNKGDAENCARTHTGSIRHRVYGPKEGSQMGSIYLYALPNQGVGFADKVYGSYHTHPWLKEDSIFSSGDFLTFTHAKHTIQIVRGCRCTRAMVALKGADYDRLTAWARAAERGSTSEDIERVESRERDQAAMLTLEDEKNKITTVRLRKPYRA